MVANRDLEVAVTSNTLKNKFLNINKPFKTLKCITSFLIFLDISLKNGIPNLFLDHAQGSKNPKKIKLSMEI